MHALRYNSGERNDGRFVFQNGFAHRRAAQSNTPASHTSHEPLQAGAEPNGAEEQKRSRGAEEQRRQVPRGVSFGFDDVTSTVHDLFCQISPILRVFLGAGRWVLTSSVISHQKHNAFVRVER